jgi:hypothetical protein
MKTKYTITAGLDIIKVKECKYTLAYLLDLYFDTKAEAEEKLKELKKQHPFFASAKDKDEKLEQLENGEKLENITKNYVRP